MAAIWDETSKDFLDTAHSGKKSHHNHLLLMPSECSFDVLCIILFWRLCPKLSFELLPLESTLKSVLKDENRYLFRLWVIPKWCLISMSVSQHRCLFFFLSSSLSFTRLKDLLIFMQLPLQGLHHLDIWQHWFCLSLLDCSILGNFLNNKNYVHICKNGHEAPFSAFALFIISNF